MADTSAESRAVEQIDVLPPSGRTPELEPYVPERQRDWVRTGVTVGLLTIFGGTLFWACHQSGTSSVQWTQAKELLQIVLPAVSGLLGSVIGFYFGSGATLERRS